MKKNLLALLFGVLGLSAQANSETLNISYVRAPFNLQMIVMKEQGLLEKELAKKNIDVKWHEITSGAKQAQALASGDLQVAGVMNTTSVLLANSEGNPVRIIAGVSRPKDTFAIVGRKGGPAAVADLKGKKVAGPKGTVLHQTLVAALHKENMTMNDVMFLQMDIPQAFAALQSGQVDAALLAAGFIINAEKEGAKVITTAAGLTSPLLVMASSEGFVKNQPELVASVRRAHDQAADWISANTEKAIQMGAKQQGISVEDAKKLYQWAHFTQRLNAQDFPSLKADMEFMLENQMMRRPVDLNAIVVPEALEQ